MKKTSVDYVLCDEADAPLVCVEFDGIAGGYNLGPQYRTRSADSFQLDGLLAWRRHITELKLKVAHAHLFPFVVVGYEEFKDLSDRIKLTIVDGIIGDVIAGMESKKTIGTTFDPGSVG